MDLSTLRSRLTTEYTGRYDFTTDTDLADYYINRAIQMLEDLQPTERQKRRHTVPMAAGAYFATIKELKTPLRIEFQNADGIVVLERLPYKEFRSNYSQFTQPAEADGRTPPVYNTATLNLGTPKHYSIYTLEPSQVQNPLNMTQEELNKLSTWGFRYGQEGLVYGRTEYDRGLMVGPATKDGGTLSVEGYFYPILLEDDVDDNWWTIRYPDLVLEAACYKLEVSNRNTEGARDWLNSIRLTLQGIDANEAEDEWASFNQMGG